MVLTAVVLCAPDAFGQSPAPQQQAALPAASPSKTDLKRAKRAWEKGVEAEGRGKWQAAFDAYSEAAGLAPANRDYVLQRERLRFRLVQQRVDRAEQAAVAGQMDAARQELRAALEMDPGYSVARERLQQFAADTGAGPQKARAAEEPQSYVVQVKPQPGTRSFNYRGNTRGAYEEVGRQFGVTVDFDDALRVRQVRFRVEDVDFPTALRLVAQQTGTFWVALEEHLIFVVEDSPQKRREFAPSVLRTVLLPESATPEQMTETLRIVRDIGGIQRTQLDTRSHTLTLRDTPENVALAVELIRQLEQPRGELMLDVTILEVDSQKAQQLGLLPPSKARIFTISPQDLAELQSPQASPAALAALLQRIFGTTGALTGGGFSLSSLVPPLIAFGGGNTVALATLPGAAADFAQTLSVLRRGRRMLLRSQDGVQATFFIGERYPVNLAVLSLSSGTGAPSGTGTGAITQRDFATGDEPVAVVAFDFNHDNFLDLAVANRAANTVSILLGNNDGTFGAATDFAAGDGPVALAVGDFDGDPNANVDLAVVNQNSGSVSILLGNGDGTFAAPSSFLTGSGAGSSPRAILATNLDPGNKLDLIVANFADDTVSVFLGNGNGTFGSKTEFPTGAGPIALAFGDFNGNTQGDLAVVNQTAIPGTVSILLGDGTGNFGAKTDFTVGNGPRAVVVGNFDADAPLDLVVANEAADSISFRPGIGDGTFGARVDFSAGDGPVALVAADLDGQGKLDLAVANHNANTVSILLGGGDGTFGLRADFAAGNGPLGLVGADLNADGRIDLAVTNQNADTVTVVLNSTILASANQVFQPQPYPGFQYEDLGLKVRATPRLHAPNEVTLQLQIEIRSLGTESLNGIPVISNRTLEQTVRLRENETTVLSGILQREERRGIESWPGLATAPVAGRITGRRDTQNRETELVILVTPRKLRLQPRLQRSLYAGRETGATTIVTPAQQQQQPPPQ